jgi:hypothetical protein
MAENNFIQGEFLFSEPSVDPYPGPSVDLPERAEHLGSMLNELGAMSRADGFKQIASQGDDRHVELAERYGGDVTQVVLAVEQKQEVSARLSRVAFAKAFGLKALISSGLVTEADAKRMASESYQDEVLPLFQKTQGADNRKKMRSWLNYQTRVLSSESTRRPKFERPSPNSVGAAKATETVQLEPEPVAIDETRKSESISRSEKLRLQQIKEIESLQGHRIAGPGNRNQAIIRTISNNDTECLVMQGSNGNAQLVVPKAYADAVARALDNGAKKSDIEKLLNTKAPTMSARVAGKRSGRPRRAVRYR